VQNDTASINETWANISENEEVEARLPSELENELVEQL